MAKTSEETRLNLFPALMHRLDEPPDYALGSIAQGMYGFDIGSKGDLFNSCPLKAVSLSGFAFVSSGKEDELLYIIE